MATYVACDGVLDLVNLTCSSGWQPVTSTELVDDVVSSNAMDQSDWDALLPPIILLFAIAFVFKLALRHIANR